MLTLWTLPLDEALCFRKTVEKSMEIRGKPSLYGCVYTSYINAYNPVFTADFVF